MDNYYRKKDETSEKISYEFFKKVFLFFGNIL